MTLYDCIVVGAGPGGLSTSFYLQQHDLYYNTLDKGEVGQSWKEMSACFSLITPMWTNALPGDRFLNPFRTMTCNQYGAYLQRYAIRKRLSIQPYTTVRLIEIDSGSLYVHTDRGILVTKTLVSAAGYFSNPYQPDTEIESTSECLVMHASHYHSIDMLKQRRVQSALIVGKRNTAGQLLVDLHNAGICVSLSIRNPLTFRENASIGRRIKECLYFFGEVFLIRRHPDLRLESFPPMDSRYAKTIIDSGAVTLYPNVRRISGKTVLFENGSSAMFDAVIFATGYHPELRHLRGLLPPTTSLSYATAFEMEKQHIFLVGLDNLYNYRSRYIRGMRSDAKVVVEKIKQAVLTYPNPDNALT